MKGGKDIMILGNVASNHIQVCFRMPGLDHILIADEKETKIYPGCGVAFKTPAYPYDITKQIEGTVFLRKTYPNGCWEQSEDHIFYFVPQDVNNIKIDDHETNEEQLVTSTQVVQSENGIQFEMHYDIEESFTNNETNIQLDSNQVNDPEISDFEIDGTHLSKSPCTTVPTILDLLNSVDSANLDSDNQCSKTIQFNCNNQSKSDFEIDGTLLSKSPDTTSCFPEILADSMSHSSDQQLSKNYHSKHKVISSDDILTALFDYPERKENEYKMFFGTSNLSDYHTIDCSLFK
jgi:hypothetical protein